MGFLNRPQAEHRLRSSPAGTFLIRFSESVTGALAIAYMQEDGRSINTVLVYMTAGGFTTTYGNEERTFETIDGLLRCTGELQFLHPDVPKAAAFQAR